MSKGVTVEYCAVNVAANPHPQGVYLALLKKAALSQVGYWGDHYATISEPVEREPGIYMGRLVAWTEINTDEPGVDKQKLEEVNLADLDFRLPENLGFNGRIFLYSFRESDHTMFVEVKNEFGKTLSPGRVEKILAGLFSPDVQGADSPLVEVTIIPDEDTLNRIFALRRLKRLEIHLLRPNADDIDVQEVLDELEEQKAKAMHKALVAAPGEDGLEPDERTTKQARVAEFNGHVVGSGNEEDGGLVHLSTKKHPRIFERYLGEFGSAIGAALLVAKEAVVRRARNQNPA